MEITVSDKPLTAVTDDVILLPVYESQSPAEGLLAEMNHLTNGAVGQAFESGEMTGKPHRWVSLYLKGARATQRVLLYGAGQEEKLSPLQQQRWAGSALRTLASRSAQSVAVVMNGSCAGVTSARAIVEGALLGLVESNVYATEKEARAEITRLTLIGEVSAEAHEGVRVGTLMAEATNFARTLAHEPGNLMTPTKLAEEAAAMAMREGLSCQVLNEDEMKRIGMGALLAVSRGSAEPATLTVLDYCPSTESNHQEVIALIGKGITFDSGGISLKPADRMEEMKYDMGGGAAVIGAMQAIARLRPQVRVLGLIPASENLPSGRAVKPGDVVRSLSGKTIEVVNTDAEGRLVLADAITYAIRLGATRIVDAATLTGACVIALGEVRAGLMCNHQGLADELVAAGDFSGDRVWQLPLDREYGQLIRSEIADMKNIGNRTAGAITGAMFIKNFVGDIPWAHLDIAGTAWLDKEKPYLAKGATGFGVRLLAEFVSRCGG